MTRLSLGTRRVTVAVLTASAVLGAAPFGTATVARPLGEETSPVMPQNRADRRIEQDRSRPDSPETTRETRTLPIGAAGFLELKTLAGDISITGAPGREARIEIIKRPRGRSADEIRRSLESVRVVVDHQGERASIGVTAEGDRRYNNLRAEVSYVVTAPIGTRVSAHTASGSLVIRDIRGELFAEVTSGLIDISNAGAVSAARTISGDVKLTNVSSKGDLSVGSMSGTIRAERVTAERVDIDVASGSITARDITSSRASVRTLSGTVDFSGRLAKGGRYEFVSHSGNVRVSTTGAGYVLQANSFSGAIRPDASVGLRAATGNSRSLRGTVGDGSAVVVATTFSGNVSISRW
jgi:hypothetical protein